MGLCASTPHDGADLEKKAEAASKSGDGSSSPPKTPEKQRPTPVDTKTTPSKQNNLNLLAVPGQTAPDSPKSTNSAISAPPSPMASPNPELDAKTELKVEGAADTVNQITDRNFGTIKVTCHEAKDLTNMGVVQKQDPYIRVLVGKQSTHSSTIVGGDTMPEFNNEEIFVRIAKKYNEDAPKDVVVQLRNDHTLVDDDIGTVVIPIAEIPGQGRGEKKWYMLTSMKAGRAGQVCLTLEYISPLWITAIRAHKLPEPTIGKASPYVVLQLSKMKNQGKDCPNSGTSADWNMEHFGFDLPMVLGVRTRGALGRAMLEYQVWDKNLLKDSLFGEGSVSLHELQQQGPGEKWYPLNKTERSTDEKGVVTETKIDCGEVLLSARGWQGVQWVGEGAKVIRAHVKADLAKQREKKLADKAAAKERSKMAETAIGLAGDAATKLLGQFGLKSTDLFDNKMDDKIPLSLKDMYDTEPGPARFGLGCIRVICHEARNLYDTQVLGRQDPFLTITFGKNMQMTRVDLNAGTHADWNNEELLFDLMDTRPKDRPKDLVIRVLDKGRVADKDIGACVISLEDIKKSSESGRVWYDLTRVDGRGGQVLLTVQYVPPLWIYVCEGENLSSAQWFGRQDVFTRLVLGPYDYKTSVIVDGGKNPNFKRQGFPFNLPVMKLKTDDEIGAEQLTIEVYAKGLISNHLIGKQDLTMSQLYNDGNGKDSHTKYEIRAEKNYKKKRGFISLASSWTSTKKSGVEELDTSVWYTANAETWYSDLESVTFPTDFLPITAGEARCMVKIHQNRELGVDEKTQYQEETLGKLERRINASIEKMGGAAMVKTSCRSAKDATIRSDKMMTIYKMKADLIDKETYVMHSNKENKKLIALFESHLHAMKCTSGKEVIELFLASKRVTEDLQIALNKLASDNKTAENKEEKKAASSGGKSMKAKEKKGDKSEQKIATLQPAQPKITLVDMEAQRLPIQIIVRKWVDFLPSGEFRGFVKNGKLTGISQYFDLCYYDDVEKKQKDYAKILQASFDSFKDKVKIKDYLVDWAVTPDLSKVYVIELNPFTEDSAACLFHWYDDRKQLNDGPFEFRVRTSARKDLKRECLEVWRDLI